ncbi:MAG: PD-(D/E)XK nuclease family protein [Magnetococcales bacterium]|nr:PD-(D/E)XK nuclease family protein [Magnetococcales bacterium]
MHDILATLDQKSLILTANRRLARTLTQWVDQLRLESGATVWPTPAILPLSAWLEQCWADLLDQAGSGSDPPPALLTPWQERLLWEKMIAASPEGETLLRLPEAAKNAQAAWNLLKEWQLTLTEADTYDHEDAQAFLGWSNRFGRHCRKQGWLDQASLSDHLQRHLQQLNLPEQIFLAGFQRQTPQMNALMGALATTGVKIAPLTLPEQTGQVVRCGFASTAAELLAAAQWSRSLLTQNPNHSIGIVLPELESLLPQVVESFSRTFYPGHEPTSLDPRSKLFNLSLGSRLTTIPLVRDALLLLGLGKQMLPLEQYTALLSSPFWHGGQSEWSQRSLLDNRLRQQGLLQISLSQLRREAARGDRDAPPCPLLAATLTALLSLFRGPEDAETTPSGRNTPQLAPVKPSRWIERFSRWLTLLGWPGERSLTSGEFQTVTAWQESLTLFATLDKVTGPLALGDALELLQRLLAEIPFQPEADAVPIQIMGILEAIGSRHSHLWILGLSEESWPPPLQPNPFLPIALQRAHGMPHAAFEQEAAYHATLLQTLLATADTVVCSHPNWNKDQPLRPTPQIMAWPEGHVEGEPVPDYNRLLFESARLTTLVDACGPPYPLAQTVPVSTAAIQAQALCPFQAFARFRLGARSQPEPTMGLDPSQRGQIVHSALTQLWQDLESSQTDINSLDSQETPLVQTVVRKTLDKASQQWPDPLHPFFRQLEDARLNRLLQIFLALERERRHPFRVLHQELEKKLTLGELTVRVRMDRVDQLADGSQVVLDYKTGTARVTDWFGERPRDPQLPLYLLAQEQGAASRVAAVAFCQVQAGACQFSGLAKQEGVLPRVDSLQKHAPDLADWPALIAHWRGVLTALGENFLQGAAQVDPLPQGCQYCDLPPLCRHQESLRTDEPT